MKTKDLVVFYIELSILTLLSIITIIVNQNTIFPWMLKNPILVSLSGFLVILSYIIIQEYTYTKTHRYLLKIINDGFKETFENMNEIIIYIEEISKSKEPLNKTVSKINAEINSIKGDMTKSDFETKLRLKTMEEGISSHRSLMTLFVSIVGILLIFIGYMVSLK